MIMSWMSGSWTCVVWRGDSTVALRRVHSGARLRLGLGAGTHRVRAPHGSVAGSLRVCSPRTQSVGCAANTARACHGCKLTVSYLLGRGARRTANCKTKARPLARQTSQKKWTRESRARVPNAERRVWRRPSTTAVVIKRGLAPEKVIFTSPQLMLRALNLKRTPGKRPLVPALAAVDNLGGTEGQHRAAPAW